MICVPQRQGRNSPPSVRVNEAVIGLSSILVALRLVSELVCYYGPTVYQISNQSQRDAFTKFLDDTSKSNSNTNSSTGSQISDTSSKSALQKYKLHIFGAAGALGLFVVLTAVCVAVRRRSPSKNMAPTRTSVESDFEATTASSEIA